MCFVDMNIWRVFCVMRNAERALSLSSSLSLLLPDDLFQNFRLIVARARRSAYSADADKDVAQVN